MCPRSSFETIPQLSYAIDLSQPARFDGQGRLVQPDAQRIVGLRFGGQPVLARRRRFLMVTNNHRAGRARLQDPLADPQVVYTDGARVQSIIAAQVQRQGSVGAAPERNWHFLPMPGTSVTIATGDSATAHLGDIASLPSAKPWSRRERLYPLPAAPLIGYSAGTRRPRCTTPCSSTLTAR